MKCAGEEISVLTLRGEERERERQREKNNCPNENRQGREDEN
jgi:hypothetical protein